MTPPAPAADAPVFVVGCPRSGTTLLYHMLVSSGGFVDYRSESHVYNVFATKFGSFRRRSARVRFMERWLRTGYFARTGLEAPEIRAAVVEGARSWGGFLRLVMEAMAREQGRRRWAECTPHHVLHLPDIARDLPGARVLHLIRDGRDVALSMDRLGWVKALPGDRAPRVVAAGAYWSWIVAAGRRAAERSGLPTLEVRFEDLVTSPQTTLDGIGRFIDHDLDYERITASAVGSVARPNSSFSTEGGRFNPVGRWREQMETGVARAFEDRLGATLRDLGYEVSSRAPRRRSGYERAYAAYFGAKQLAKTRTPLGRVFARTVMGDGDGRTRNVMSPGRPA